MAQSSFNIEEQRETIEKCEIEDVKRKFELISHGEREKRNSKMVSAAATAIKHGMTEDYEHLISKRVLLDPDEDIDELVEGLPDITKVKLRNIHRKYVNDINLTHLGILTSCSKLSHEASNTDNADFSVLIAEAFSDLNSINLVKPILQVASTSLKLQIIFDFNRSSVEFLDPTKCHRVLGTTYPQSGYIYIGAKGLRTRDKHKNEDRCKVLGVMIHELCHFAVQLVYNNNAKPYHKNGDKMNEFQDIFMATKTINYSDLIIGNLSTYPVEDHHAELIVRVPQLVVQYKDNRDKYSEVSREFIKLFNFYTENTLVDLERQHPLMEAKREVRKLNDLCGSLTSSNASAILTTSQPIDELEIKLSSDHKFLFVTSNGSQITIRAILQRLRNDNDFEYSYLFSGLSLLENSNIFGKILKTLKRRTNLTLIIDCTVGNEKVSEVLEKFKSNDICAKVVFVAGCSFLLPADSNSTIKTINHTWNHLTSDFQKLILEKKVQFQTIEMQFGELLSDLSLMKSIPFDDFLSGRMISLGKNLELKNPETLVERKFLTSNSRPIEYASENYDIELDFDGVLAFLGENQTILLTDKPGMGKLTTLEMLQTKLQAKYPTSWIVFMDLKSHFKAFHKTRFGFDSREQLLNFVTLKILKIESFEAEVFTYLYNENRVVFIFDGLDEICPTYKEFIFGLMSDIQKSSKNQIWMSTRPHLIHELEKALMPVVLHLKPFTRANRREFLNNHFSSHENIEQKIREIEIFLAKLDGNRWYIDPVANPLIMRMIVEIPDVVNLKFSEINLYELYDMFTRSMIEKAMDKGPDAKKDIVQMAQNSDELNNFHAKNAFHVIFFSIIMLTDDEFDKLFTTASTPSLDKIVRVGLMFSDGSGQMFQFIQKTFAEFYVAKFFFEKVFPTEKKQTTEDLTRIGSFFIDRILPNSVDSNHDRMEAEFFLLLLDSALQQDTLIESIIFPDSIIRLMQIKLTIAHYKSLIQNNCLSIIKVFARCLSSGAQAVLFERGHLDYQNLLMVAFKCQSIDFIKGFIKLLRKIDSAKSDKLFSERDINGCGIFHYAAGNHRPEIFKFAVERCTHFMTVEQVSDLLIRGSFKGSVLQRAVTQFGNFSAVAEVLGNYLNPGQLTRIISEKDDRRRNLIHTALQEPKIAQFQALLSFMKAHLNGEDLEKIIFERDDEESTALDFAMRCCKEKIFELTKKFYSKATDWGRTRNALFDAQDNELNNDLVANYLNKFYLNLKYFPRLTNPNRFVIFVAELFEIDMQTVADAMLQTRNKNGATTLMIVAIESDEIEFNAILSFLDKMDEQKRIEILQAKNSRSETVFHFAARNCNKNIFEKVAELYQRNLKDSVLRKIFSECEKCCFHDIIRRESNSETLSSLCHFFEMLFKGTAEVELIKGFYTFADHQKVSMQTRASNLIVLTIAVEQGHEKFECLFNLAKEIFTIETMKEILLAENSEGDNSLFTSFRCNSVTTYTAVKKAYQCIFDGEEMDEIILKYAGGSHMLRCCLVSSGNTELFQILCNYLKDIFMRKNQKLSHAFLTDVDQFDQSILMYAANTTWNHFEILLSLSETLNQRDQMQIYK